MSRENVEIIRRHYEAFNRRDLAAIIGRTDPEAEWQDRADDPDAAVHRGHAGITKHFADLAAFAEFRIEPQEFIEARDSVVVPVRLHGRGRTSEVPFEAREVHVFRLRNGLVIETREYREISEALKAVGLTE